MAFVYPGGSPNTFTPSYEASGVIVNMVRDPSQFKINSYIGSTKVDHGVGYYLYLDNSEAARFISSNDFEWPDGNEFNAETGFTNTSGFDFRAYKTDRKAVGFTLGNKSVEQASWDIVANEAAAHAQRMMTERTNRTLTTLLNASNWSGNTGSATSLGGGLWGAATTSNYTIRKTINAVTNAVNLSSAGFVRPQDLKMVVSPYTATRMAATDEIASYLKSSPFALGFAEGDDYQMNWGLPKSYAGVEIVVEDCVNVTTKKGATVSTGRSMDDNKVLFLARKDSLVSNGTASRFNTCNRFYLEDFTTEIMNDPNNRRVVGRIVVDDQIVLVAPATGYLVTAVFS